MTITKPSRFQKNGESIVDVIRGFGFRAVLACVICASSIAMHSHSASATCAIESDCDPGSVSWDAYLNCNAQGGTETECDIAYFWADPRGQRRVRSFHLELKFDPHQYTFDPSQSGPVCGFARNYTPCRAPRARLGTFVIQKTGPLRGTPPAGAKLSYGDEPNSSGLVTLDYSVPKGVNLSKDQNVFVLAFRLTNPIPAGSRVTVSYFKEPDEHQFQQIAFSCNNGAIRCGGHPAIRGVDIAATPSR